MKHISKALIAMLICMAALIAPSVGAIGNEIVRVEGCDAADFDLMANDIGYDFTDIKKTANYVIDGGEYFIVSYGNRIAQFEVDDSGLLTLYPLMRGEGKVYYYVTKNGRNYIRYANVQINDDCDIIEEPVEILSPLPGDKCYPWREYPISTNVPADTFVDGVPTGVFAPENGGSHEITAVAEDGSEDSVTIVAEYFPHPDDSRIIITYPEIGIMEPTGLPILVTVESPLLDRNDFDWECYTTSPAGDVAYLDGVVNEWRFIPDVPGTWGITVRAVGIGNAYTFGAGHDYEVYEFTT